MSDISQAFFDFVILMFGFIIGYIIANIDRFKDKSKEGKGK